MLLLALEDPSLFKPFMKELLKLPLFTKYSELVELCIDDSTEVSPLPFFEQLKQSPGDDKELWDRQFLSLKILSRVDSEKLEEVKPTLMAHPSPAIKSWFKSESNLISKKVIKSEKGDYELIMIPGGEFMMGSSDSDKDRYDDEGPLHMVKISGFYMGKYPVTNDQYGKFLQENPEVTEPEYWGDRSYNQPIQPIVGVSWDDACRYAKWAGFSLPTEAMWKYACRGGTATVYSSGDTGNDLDVIGWYKKNSDDKLHNVGEKEPNEFGLYDMYGNVYEWVQDWYGENYYRNSPSDNAGLTE